MPTTYYFAGDAAAVPQIDTIALAGTWAAGDTLTITINGKDLVWTVVTGTTPTEVVAELAAAYANLTKPPEHAELTASVDPDDATRLRLTGAANGAPFTISSVTETATGTATHKDDGTAGSVEPDGPNWWSAENFLTSGVRGTLPANGDSVVFAESDVDCTYGLDQSAVDLVDLDIKASYTGKLGLDAVNVGGSEAYQEYRQRYLYCGFTGEIKIGEGAGAGSGRIMINCDEDEPDIYVYATASSDDAEAHAVQLRNISDQIPSGSGSDLDVIGGTVEIDETAFINTLKITGTAQVRCHNQSAYALQIVHVEEQGQLITYRDIDELNMHEQSAVVHRGDTITQPTIYSGTLTIIPSAPFKLAEAGDTLILGSGAVIDASLALETITIDACTAFPGCNVQDPGGHTIWTSAMDTQGGQVIIGGDYNMNFGRGRSIKPS